MSLAHHGLQRHSVEVFKITYIKFLKFEMSKLFPYEFNQYINYILSIKAYIVYKREYYDKVQVCIDELDSNANIYDRNLTFILK